MIKRFLIIEDRPERQKNILTFELPKSSDSFKNIPGGIEFTAIKESLENKEFNMLNQFDIIAIHRSSISVELRNNLIDYCKEKNKDLVLFSGGISSALLQKLDNSKMQMLTINVKDFYSENLKHFLESDRTNLMILAFGKRWEINVMMHLAVKIYNEFTSLEVGDEKEFQEIYGLTDWEITKFFSEYSDSSRITKDSLYNVLKKINEEIKNFIL